MHINKKPTKMVKKNVRASEEIAPEPIVDVAPEATELLFETEDVAQLLAEVTDEEVTADVDEDTEEIVFTVGDEEYVVAPEGDEELLEASTRVRAGKSVRASRARAGKMVRASRRVSSAHRSARR